MCSSRDRRRRTAVPESITSSRARSRTSSAGIARCADFTSRAKLAGTRTACRWRSRSRKQLGISGKQQIEEIGVEEFNQLCRESVWKYRADWEKLSERIGFWLDYSDPYVTYSNNYIESVWWALKTLYDKEPAVSRAQDSAVLRALRHRALES